MLRIFKASELEYKKAKQELVYVENKDLKVLCFSGSSSGADTEKFLCDYSTQDPKKMKEAQFVETAFLNSKGQIVCLGYLIKSGDDFLYIISEHRVGVLQEHLKAFLFFSETKLEVIEDKYFLYSIFGSGLNLDSNFTESVFLSFSEEKYSMPCQFCLVLKNENISFKNYLETNKIALVASELLETLRIEAGYPKDALDIENKNLLHELNLDLTAVDFNKGCYLGQETVARVQSRGHVNKSLVALKISERVDLPFQMKVQTEKIVGDLSSMAYSYDYESWIALAIVKHKALEKLSEVVNIKVELLLK